MRRALLRWVLWTVGVALLIAIPLIPRDRERQPWWAWGWEDYPEVREAARAQSEARLRWANAERRWRRADARARVAEARSRMSGSLTVLASAGFQPIARTRLDSTARAELAAMGVRSPAYPILIMAIADSARISNYRYQRIVVLPDAPGDPCAIIILTPKAATSGRGIVPDDRLLGTCAFYAAHGAPGAGTAAWLRETNIESAGYLLPPAGAAGDTALLNFESFYGEMRRPEIRGCRARREDACVALISPTPAHAREFNWYYESEFVLERLDPGVTVLEPHSLARPAADITLGLLSSLARDLGPRRFESLWRSERGVAEEFERQEGRSLADWTADHLATRVVLYDPGPGIPLFASALALAIILTALAFATLRARRVMS